MVFRGQGASTLPAGHIVNKATEAQTRAQFQLLLPILGTDSTGQAGGTETRHLLPGGLDLCSRRPWPNAQFLAQVRPCLLPAQPRVFALGEGLWQEEAMEEEGFVALCHQIEGPHPLRLLRIGRE